MLTVSIVSTAGMMLMMLTVSIVPAMIKWFYDDNHFLD